MIKTFTDITEAVNSKEYGFIIYSSNPVHLSLSTEDQTFYSRRRTCYINPANLGNNGAGFSFDPTSSEQENFPFFAGWIATASLFPMARKIEFLVRRSAYSPVLLPILMFDVKRGEEAFNNLICSIREMNKQGLPISEAVAILAILLDLEKEIQSKSSTPIPTTEVHTLRHPPLELPCINYRNFRDSCSRAWRNPTIAPNNRI